LSTALAKSNPNWLALHENRDVRELILELSAQGLPDVVIAKQIRQTGLVERITPEDVTYYKTRNAAEITAYVQKNSKQLLAKSINTSNTYRVGALDRLLEIVYQKINELIETGDIKGANMLIGNYLKGQQQMGLAVGDITTTTDPKNTWIEVMQKLTPRQRETFTALLVQLDKIAREAGQSHLLSADIQDGEFEVQET